MQKLVWQNANGDSIDLTSGNYGITEWEGFSNASLNIQNQQVPFQDGAVFLDALIEPRELSVTLKMQDKGNLEARYEMRRELIHSLNPKLGEGYLIYTNDFISKRIKCIPQIPLFETHNSDTRGTPSASLAWTACEPYWEDLEETVVNLPIGTNVMIDNNGDIPCGVEIKIESYNIDTPLIRNITNNKIIKINGLINSNIDINTNVGKKQVAGKVCGMLPQVVSDNFRQIIYNAKVKKYFAVGLDFYSSFYGVSEDRENWRFIYVGTYRNFSYSEVLGYFILVQYHQVKKSYDGENWEKIADTDFQHLCIDRSEKLGFFCGVKNTDVYLSYDGYAWNKINIPSSVGGFHGVQWVEEIGKFYLFQDNDISYTFDGENFVPTNLQDTTQIKRIEELNLFIACGRTNGKIQKSSDGITWTEIVITNVSVDCLVWNGQKIIASGYNTNNLKYELYESTDGVNFSYIADSDYSIYDMYYENTNKYIGVGALGLIEKSSDGITWDLLKLGVGSDYNADAVFTFCNNNHKLYALGTATGKLISTSNCVNWDFENTNITLRNIKWIKEKNIFLGFTGSQIVSSTNGINWTNRKATSYCGDFCYSKSQDKIYALYVTYNQSTNKTELHSLTSTNGTSWTDTKRLEMSGQIEFNDYNLQIAYSDITGVFIGGDGVNLFRSADGTTWTYTELTTGMYVNSIFRVDRDGYFYSVYDKLWKSADGITWTPITLKPNISLNSGYFAEPIGTYCIVSEYINPSYNAIQSAIFYSLDGINFEEQLYESTGSGYSNTSFNENVMKFVTGNTRCISAVSQTEQDKNLINSMSNESDIGLNLEIGTNNIICSKRAGQADISIIYRQKYIGV